jgi:uncharacterized repeat protein (TIGR02543 family)
MRAAPIALVLAALALLLGAPASAGPTQSGDVLTVTVVGNGHVTSDDGQIECPTDCTAEYFEGGTVTLSATPDSGWFFAGWSGDCSGTGSCVVDMGTGDHSVTATFEPVTTHLTVAVVGQGHVTSDDEQIDCPSDCMGTYFPFSVIPTPTLTADPDPGWIFVGWSGDCSGTGDCTVSMDEDRSVTATFEQIAVLTVQIDKGEGTVTSDDGQIDCPPDCTGTYFVASEGGPRHVKLTAHPAEGWVFVGWNHDCAGDGSCEVVMDQDHFVTARFEKKQEHPTTTTTTTTTAPGTFGLTVSIVGTGSVGSSPGGINCGAACAANYPQHQMVTLVPVPGAGWQFAFWGGDCSGSGGCKVTMDGPRHVTATFTQRTTTDEIGPPTNPINDNGFPGDNSLLTFVFVCFAPEDLWLDQVFVDLLHREADRASLDAYFPRLVGGLPRPGAALEVLRSAEYRTMLVQSYYTGFLHRPATPQEVALGVAMLAAGATDEDVAATILGSPEYLTSRGGGTNAGFVAALYQDLLGRAPTSAEQAQFGTAFANGATRAQIALQVLRSAEYRTRLIRGWFQAYLDRAPTDAELAAYLARFAAGETDEQLQASILGSQEYFDKLADYKASIDWGDGTVAEGVVRHALNQGRGCVVTGRHTFPTTGNKPVSIEITDPDGGTEKFTGFMRIQQAPPPPPGRENVQPFGTVLIKVGGRFVPLTNFRVVPLGTELDTTNGRVRLTSTDGSTGLFFEGRFKIQRVFETINGRRRAVTLLSMTLPITGCPKRTTSGVTQAPRPGKKIIRHVWGNAKGSFRTRGKFASATVRGTLWETLDYCDGTLVIVKRGRLDVFDFVRRVHRLVGAGHSLFVRAP